MQEGSRNDLLYPKKGRNRSSPTGTYNVLGKCLVESLWGLAVASGQSQHPEHATTDAELYGIRNRKRSRYLS